MGLDLRRSPDCGLARVKLEAVVSCIPDCSDVLALEEWLAVWTSNIISPRHTKIHCPTMSNVSFVRMEINLQESDHIPVPVPTSSTRAGFEGIGANCSL